jgi:hypothetical protein
MTDRFVLPIRPALIDNLAPYLGPPGEFAIVLDEHGSIGRLRPVVRVDVATLLANRRPDLSIPPSPAEVGPITQSPRRKDQQP